MELFGNKTFGHHMEYVINNKNFLSYHYNYNFRAIGSHNIWLSHVETSSENNHDFKYFVEKILNSQLEVQEKFPDDFHECLFKHHCLDSGPQRLLICLRSDCQWEDFVGRAKLAKCISDKDQKVILFAINTVYLNLCK